MLAPSAPHNLDETEPRPLSAEQAHQVRELNPSVSLRKIVMWQLIIAVIGAVGVSLWSQEARLGWSVMYGAAAVIIPSLVFYWGMKRQSATASAGLRLWGFFFWEGVKLVATVAMLVLATKVVKDLNWPALLVSLIVTLKIHWAAVGTARLNTLKSKR